MSSKKLDDFVKIINDEFNVEVAICKVFQRRWSYVTGTKEFIGGKYKIMINEKYGIIINCEAKDLIKVKNFIYQKRNDFI